VNIVHLLAPAKAGGLERVVQGLAIGQRDRGHNVVIVAVVQAPMIEHPFRLPLDRAGIDVREIVIPHRAYRQERRAVAKLCAEVAADVVHGHGSRPDVVNGDVLRRLGIATVSTNHGPTAGPWRNRLYEHLHRRVLRRFDAVIPVSEPIAADLIGSGVPSSRVHVVPNAWSQIGEPRSREEARHVLGLPDDARVAGWVGRMSREKGVDVFIDALWRLGDSRIVGCAVGDGPERAREQARADATLGPRLVWPGMIPEAGRLARAFDVFVLSSRTEGIPLALLEAMASGTPIVATRVGGVPSVVSEREALLVPADQPEALAHAIASAMSDPVAGAERAERGTARLATAFGREQWLDRHDSIYTIARERRRSASDRG
jgi:glycosyltransferase involved in cell wall biosynthesis